MDIGLLLRGAGVVRAVLGFMGSRRIAWGLAIAISVGWFVVSAARADAATGAVDGTVDAAVLGASIGAVAVWVCLAYGLCYGANRLYLRNAGSSVCDGDGQGLGDAADADRGPAGDVRGLHDGRGVAEVVTNG